VLDDVEAVVLVGGKGTRLRPLTLSAPKPMLPTAGVPFLAHLLSRIQAAGVRRVVLGTSYMAETFAKEFGDGEALGLELVYVVEDHPLGTGGGIRNVAKHLTTDHVLVFNGDVLCGTDLRAVVGTHRETAADVTLHLVRVPDPRAYGCVPTDATGQVLEFLEKTEDPPTDQINAGCYVFRRSVIDSIPEGRPVSVERETFPGLLSSGARVSGHVDNAYWRDMGTPADLAHGSADLVRGVAPSAALPGPTGEALVLAGAEVASDALVFGGSTVGRGVTIGAGARVDGSMLFDGAVVAPGAVVEQSIVGAGAHIDEGATLRDTVVGDRAVVGAHCELRRGMRVWPDIVLPPHGVRFSPDV
jgi:mannose-1-phosphate guanylyltransferase